MENEKLCDLMVDIETLGNTSNSVICSLAAVQFDLETGETGRSFQINIDIQSCLDAGLKIDADTLKWWFKQSDAARQLLFEDAVGIQVALKMFYIFVSDLIFTTSHPTPNLYKIKAELGKSDVKIWGNSNRFDLGIIENAFYALGMETPWKHWNERDVRTLVSLAPDIKYNMPFEGIKHDPKADCLHQIKYCTATYRKITGRE